MSDIISEMYSIVGKLIEFENRNPDLTIFIYPIRRKILLLIETAKEIEHERSNS